MNSDQEGRGSKDASGKPDVGGGKTPPGVEPHREGIYRQAEASPQKEPDIPAVAGKDGKTK